MVVDVDFRRNKNLAFGWYIGSRSLAALLERPGFNSQMLFE